MMAINASESRKPAMNNAAPTPVQRPSNGCATLSPIPPRCCTRPSVAGCTPGNHTSSQQRGCDGVYQYTCEAEQEN